MIPTALWPETRRKPTMEGAARTTASRSAPDGRAPSSSTRWRRRRKRRGFPSLLCTQPRTGSQIAVLGRDGDLVSHFDWRDPQHVLP